MKYLNVMNAFLVAVFCAECSNAVVALSLPTSSWGRRPRRTAAGNVTRVTRVVRGRGRRTAQSELAAGQQTQVSWTPNNAHGHLGISFCSDRGQSLCYMFDAQGVAGGRVGFWWRRHGAQEQGLLSWVPGRVDQVPETILSTEQRVSTQ